LLFTKKINEIEIEQATRTRIPKWWQIPLFTQRAAWSCLFARDLAYLW